MGLFKGTVIGHLGRDPETRFTPGGAMNVSFSVAATTKRGQEDHTEWVRCTCWNKLAEIAEQLAESGGLVKGKQVYVSGTITTASYTSKNGQPGYSVDMRVDDLQLLGKKGDDESAQVDSRQRARPSLGDDFDEPPF